MDLASVQRSIIPYGGCVAGKMVGYCVPHAALEGEPPYDCLRS